MRFLYTFLLLLCFTTVFAQSHTKTLTAVKTSTPPKIDGLLDDPAWVNVPIATDFVELNPVAGRHEKPEERTEIKIIYDDDAIYVGARMYETSGSKVAHELANRDNVGTTDFIGLVIDTYHDGINAVGFYSTAAGVQFDAKYSPSGNGSQEDATWNAVWLCKAHIDDKGWTAEFKIPYSALRFAKKDVQFWGLQFVRKRQVEQKQLFWNEIDPKKNGFINQEGDLVGIKNITPPVRLGFYPYMSTYVNHYPYNTAGLKNTSFQFDGGMDVKYGINESFTLDLTLIPDFGQVQSDNQVLNLTPFEVKYVENRPFFTEGTELFNKGNLFYSRRVGGTPIDYSSAYDNLKPGETVVKNPTETKLLNAVKVSGRTSSGLGIGIFNAITDPTYATIQDSAGHTHQFRTSPLVNYNILVLDQNLKNNSSVTLINTNVDRFGKDYSADVGGFAFNLYNNEANTYNLRGFAFMSNIYNKPGEKTSTGYSYEINAGKSSGNFTWLLTEDHVDDKYDPNDLGILLNNNYFDHNFNWVYANYKPKKYFTEWDVFGNVYYSRRYYPSAYQFFNQILGFDFKLKNYWYIGLNFSHYFQGNDFYEPRVAGRVFQSPENNNAGIYFSTNPADRFYWGFDYFYRQYVNDHGGYGHDVVAYYNLRINDHFSFGQNVSYLPRINNIGYSTVDSISNNPIFAVRTVQTLENIFNIKYTFNNVMGLTFRLRHYWSKLSDHQFYDLAQNGSLAALTSSHFNRDDDMNYNDWNIDMLYVWEFSPGSELSIDWKNSSLIDNDQAHGNYFNNFENTIHTPKNNNFSLKILYYIDYQDLRKKHKKSI